MPTRRVPSGSNRARRAAAETVARWFLALAVLAAGVAPPLPRSARADSQVGLCHEGYYDSCVEDCDDDCYEDNCLDGYPACVAQCSTLPADQQGWCVEDCDVCDDAWCPQGAAACQADCRKLPPDQVSDCLDNCDF